MNISELIKLHEDAKRIYLLMDELISKMERYDELSSVRDDLLQSAEKVLNAIMALEAKSNRQS